tara:strand:+ start:28276 stop:29190 length:915 start_codon:yes stop_codon:yes gene_type:complete
MSENLPDDVFTLDALRDFTPVGVQLGVVGWPVRHSISPPMHRAALKVLSTASPRFSDWRYDAFELQPEDLAEGVELFRKKGFRGINLTVPHKVEVLPLLDEIDPVAAKMGAVNTLFFKGSRLEGYNTDGYGLENAVKEAFGQGLTGRDIVILGAGGASRAAVAQCIHSSAKSILVANRTLDKAQAIIDSQADELGRGSAISMEEVPAAAAPGSLIINATSLGLSQNDPSPISVDELPEGCLLYDMIYNPARTPFLEAGLLRGYPIANGLGMLVHQGVRSLEIWTDEKVSAQAMRIACEQALAAR